jgi:hypothetical protein
VAHVRSALLYLLSDAPTGRAAERSSGRSLNPHFGALKRMWSACEVEEFRDVKSGAKSDLALQRVIQLRQLSRFSCALFTVIVCDICDIALRGSTTRIRGE